MRHQRTVTWIRDDVPRDAIDQDLRYSLGAFLTVCRIKRNNAEERIRALLDGAPLPGPKEGNEAIDDDGPDITWDTRTYHRGPRLDLLGVWATIPSSRPRCR